MEAVNTPVRLLDIEHELAGPGKMEAMAKYDAILIALDERIEEAKREGLSMDDYQNAEALKEANIIARKILRLTVRVGGQA